MLVVSLRGVNFRFHLGCSGENTIICNTCVCSPYVAMSVLFRVSHKEI